MPENNIRMEQYQKLNQARVLAKSDSRNSMLIHCNGFLETHESNIHIFVLENTRMELLIYQSTNTKYTYKGIFVNIIKYKDKIGEREWEWEIHLFFWECETSFDWFWIATKQANPYPFALKNTEGISYRFPSGKIVNQILPNNSISICTWYSRDM